MTTLKTMGRLKNWQASGEEIRSGLIFQPTDFIAGFSTEENTAERNVSVLLFDLCLRFGSTATAIAATAASSTAATTTSIATAAIAVSASASTATSATPITAAFGG